MKYFLAFVLRGGGALSTIIFTIVVAKLFSQSDSAQWFVLLNGITIASVVVRWGLDEVIVKYLASSSGKKQKFRRTVRLAVFLVRRIGIGVAFICLFFPVAVFAAYAYGFVFADIFIATVAALAVAILMCLARLFQANGFLNTSAIFLTIMLPCFSVFVVIFFMNTVELSYRFLLVVYAVVSVVVLIVCLLLLVKNKMLYFPSLRLLARVVFSRYDVFKKESSSANSLGFVVIANQSVPWFSILLLPIYFGPGDVTAFVVLQKLSMALSLLFLMVNFSMSQKIAALFGERNYRFLSVIFWRGLLFILGFSLVFLFFVFLYYWDFVGYLGIDGERYFVLSVFMMLGQVFFGLSTYCAMYMTMAGNEKVLSKAIMFVSAISVFLIFIGCSTAIVNVVAVVYFISYFCLAAFLFYLTYKKCFSFGCCDA